MKLFDTYRLIDRVIGSTLCIILGGLTKLIPTIKRQPHRILVVRLWGMGDAIVSLPVLKALQDKYPNAKIDVLCRRRNKSVFLNQDFVRKILEFEYAQYVPLLLMFGRYDLVVDLEQYLNVSALLSWWLGRKRMGFSHGVRSLCYHETYDYSRSQHMLKNYLGIVGLVGATYDKDHLLPLKVGKDAKDFVDKYMASWNLTDEDLKIGVQVCVAESGKTRLWTNEKFAKLCDKLVKKHRAKIIFVGGPVAVEANDKVIQLMEQKAYNCCAMSKRQAFEFFRRLNMVISLDTGPMHLGAAQGVPTVGIFGPNTPVLWAPYGSKNTVVYKKVSCSPCILNELGRMPVCERTKDKHICMKSIEPEDVSEAVEKIL
ncbi:MAG: glycosyltransferase family 9 protein [Candidatus Nanoarchaeia archaeon]